MHATYQHFVPGLLYLAGLFLSHPVSNLWPERGASAVKRLKTMMHSRLRNDTLGALLHVTRNGPDQLIKATVREWMNIKPRKKTAKGKELGGQHFLMLQQKLISMQHQTQITSLEEEEMEQSEDEMLQGELEVNPALKEMKLPQPEARCTF